MWRARVVSDDPELIRHVQCALAPDLSLAESGAEKADLVVIDQRCTSLGLRSVSEQAAVMVLVGRGDYGALEAALASPADDALQFPAAGAELRARAVAALRRRAGAAGGARVPWYDRRRREVQGRDGVRRRLTRSECVLLERLLEKPGAVVPRDALLWCLAVRPLEVESNVVERHVATLRAKLRDDAHTARYIETVPRRGYRLQPAALTQR